MERHIFWEWGLSFLNYFNFKATLKKPNTNVQIL